MRIKLLYVFAVVAISQMVHAQSATSNIWYFGANAGLNFNLSPPIPLADGKLNTTEGCASICDTLGNLLFYTDGVTIWDRAHNSMPNGKDLAGGASSSQSAQILKKPGNNALYCLFTVAQEVGKRGFSYYEIDMNANNGFGDVILGHERLQTNTAEKIAYTQHVNGQDFWVLVRGFRPENIHAYLLTENGLSDSPVSSNASIGIWSGVDVESAMGCMKLSHDGGLLAVNHFKQGITALYQFDNNTGETTPIEYFYSGINAYGLEFSPNNRWLYVTARDFTGEALFQIDMKADDRVKTKTVIYRSEHKRATEIELGSLQLGPDGKIYLAHFKKSYLSAILEPNNQGSNCGFQLKQVKLDKSTKSMMGLPNLAYPNLPANFKYINNCEGQPVKFNASHLIHDSLEWLFGDKDAPQNAKGSILPKATHTYTKAGEYKVRLLVKNNNNQEEYVQTIKILPSPKPSLGEDVSLCEHKAQIIGTSPEKDVRYIWNTGEEGPSLTVNTSGRYILTADLRGCISRDTIDVTFIHDDANYLGNDTVVCEGDSLKLKAPLGNTIEWFDGSAKEEMLIKKAGSYWLKVSNEHCSTTDTIHIREEALPISYLPSDTQMCAGSKWSLKVAPKHYMDVGLEKVKIDEIKFTGTYNLRVENDYCISYHQLHVSHIECPYSFEVPSVVSPNGDGYNDKFQPSSIQNIDSFHLQVFNRWGQVLFETDDVHFKWDMKHMSASTVFWKASYRNHKGEDFATSGSLLIVR